MNRRCQCLKGVKRVEHIMMTPVTIPEVKIANWVVSLAAAFATSWQWPKQQSCWEKNTPNISDVCYKSSLDSMHLWTLTGLLTIKAHNAVRLGLKEEDRAERCGGRGVEEEEDSILWKWNSQKLSFSVKWKFHPSERERVFETVKGREFLREYW